MINRIVVGILTAALLAPSSTSARPSVRSLQSQAVNETFVRLGMYSQPPAPLFKTYHHADTGISFSYPEHWFVTGKGVVDFIELGAIMLMPDTQPSGGRLTYIDIQSTSLGRMATLDDLHVAYNALVKQPATPEAARVLDYIRELSVQEETETVFKGSPALHVVFDAVSKSLPVRTDITYVAHGTRVYRIVYRSHPDLFSRNEKVYQTVLDSLSFPQARRESTVERPPVQTFGCNVSPVQMVRMRRTGKAPTCS